MKRLLLILIVMIFQALPAIADQTDAYIEAQMKERRIPGIALHVIKDGKIIKTGAYGLANLEHQVPVTPDTAFEIGSVTKQFTAAGILLLVQDGKLGIDDKISKHLPGSPTAWEPVTLRHLVSHTAGVKSYTGLDGYALTQKLTQSQFIEKLGAFPLEFTPGSQYKYSNSGYSLLGYIIENASGKSYWEFMRDRIFSPLGMNHTTDRLPGRIIPNRASGYEQTKDKVWINRDYDLTDVFSAGAIVSTIGDLAKWNDCLDNGSILTPESKTQMWTTYQLSDGKPAHYGFGWRIDTVDGREVIGHSGSTSGFSATLQRYPSEKLAIIVLTNTDETIATTLAHHIAKFYFE